MSSDSVEPGSSSSAKPFVFGCLLFVLFLGLVNGGMALLEYGTTLQRKAYEQQRLAAQIAAVNSGASSEIHLYDTQDTDSQLAALVGLKGLESLWLEQTDVTSDGLRAMGSLPNLKSIRIESGRADNAGLQWLGNQPALERLVLSGTLITDSGLPELKRLRELRFLTLGDRSSPPRLSDAGVEELHALTKLRYLDLLGSWFSDDAFQKLRKALPTASIAKKPSGWRPRPSD